MSKPKIGVLHPGEMGVAVATTAQNSGHEVYWASDGSSRRRAGARPPPALPMRELSGADVQNSAR